MKALKRSAYIVALVFLQAISLNVTAQVTAQFNVAGNRKGCSPLVVNFQNQSSGATSYIWRFGNGNSSTLVNPAVIYATPGLYTVTLIASDGVQSDTIVKTDFIEIFQDPIADFTAPVTSGCAPLITNFQDQSVQGSAPIRAWIWNFGDGSNSNQRNPTKIYSTGGNYNVTLLVVDQNGCSAQTTKSNYVVVQEVPDAQFSAPIRSACLPPLTVDFVNNSTPASGLTHEWTFGDGNVSTQQTPSNTYTALGNYDVKLKVTSSLGCVDSLVRPAYVNIQDLVADFTSNATVGCAPFTVNFTNASSIVPNSVSWDFGDGTSSTSLNPSKTYSTSGIYTVTFVAANSSSCSDTIVKTSYITVNEAPVANFSSNNTQGCSAPFVAGFTDSSTNAVSWSWNFGDGTSSGQQNPVHVYNNYGSYNVSLTVTNADGCTNTFTRNNYINIIAPEANFTADTTQGCFPVSVNFTSTVTTNDSVQNYFWNFGDGNISTDANPSHTYIEGGRFDVSLIITTVSGCIDTLVRTEFIRAGTKPNADFVGTPDTVCLFVPVVFTNLTDSSDQWFWDFGDGGVSTAFSPSYMYGDTGLFTVTLIVSNNGCLDTMVREDYVYVSPPRAEFNVIRDCSNPYFVTFTDTSLAPDVWFWDFGDSTTSIDQHPMHLYTSKGTFTVSLTVTDTVTGCTDTYTEPVLVVDVDADFAATPMSGCHPLIVQMADSSVDYNTFNWTADGMTSTAQNPSFTFTTPGIYDVELIVTDMLGCADTMLKPDFITVLGPEAEFSADPRNGCAPLSVNFTDSSYTFMSTLTSWAWTFGDGDSSSLQNPSHYYTNSGDYNVTLIVTDANGCSDTKTETNFIQPTFPTPIFSADTFSCSSRAVTFVNSSTGVGLNYYWEFGDGDTSTAAAPLHTYAAEGTYSVTLRVSDLNGCDSTITKINYVTVSNPQVDFNADSTFSPCPPLIAGFNIQATPDVISYSWDFGDGNISVLDAPSNVYMTPGVFDVQLIGTTALGCKDTMMKYDYISVLGPDGTFTFDPNNSCLGNTITFIAQTTNTASISWDYGDGIVDVNSNDTVVKVYDSYGIYHPVIILDDGVGCVRAITTQDSVLVGEIHGEFAANINYACKQGTVQFADVSFAYPDITSWLWDFGNGDTSTLQNPSYTYVNPGSYTVTLLVASSLCQDTVVKQGLIFVDPGPQADFQMSSAQGCDSLMVNFTDQTVSDSTIVAWEWNFGNGNTDTVQNTSQLFNIGQFDIEYIVTSSAGCSDTIVKQVSVFPHPIVIASEDTFMCFGESMPLSASGASTYDWLPATGLDDASSANPISSTDRTRTYTVTGTDSNNCSYTDSVVITVNPIPNGEVIEDQHVCIGGGAELWATGGLHYLWSPDDSTLSDIAIATPIARPDTTTTYSVITTNEFRCNDYDTVTVFVHPYPAAILLDADTVCYGHSVTISSATDADDYNWTPAYALSCTDCAEPVASPLHVTTYHLEVTNEFNCTTFDSITITVNPNEPAQITAPENICAGETAILEVTEGTAYEWIPANAVACSTCDSTTTAPFETTTYIVMVNNQFNCPTYDTATINVRPLPEVATIDDLNLCEGDYVQLTTETSGAVSHSWTPATGLNSTTALSPIANPTTTQTYIITALTEYSCAKSDSVTITLIDKVLTNVSGNKEICIGASTQLITDLIQSGNKGTTVIWTPVNGVSDPTTLSPFFTPDRTTEYRMVAYSGSCAPDTQYVTVVVNPLPQIEIVRDRKVSIGTNISLTLNTESILDDILWGQDEFLSCVVCDNPTYTANTSELITVEVTDNHGCKNTDDAKIDVVGHCGDDVFVPNTFTPNGDESNDKLFVRNLSLNGLKTFRIFDRWGKLVFETTDINQGWDGTYNGKTLNTGVFAYYVDVICSNGQTTMKRGNVTLMR
jgi:gliding motility-associated-like protein